MSREHKKCCICGKEFDGYGNNPMPVKDTGECCDNCNQTVVIPQRLKEINTPLKNESEKQLLNYIKDQSSEAEHKSFFVKYFLKPLLFSLDINIIHANYVYNEKTKAEYVRVTYKDGFYRRICVTGDSLRAIVSDVISKV